jgi:hypothetical protein
VPEAARGVIVVEALKLLAGLLLLLLFPAPGT